MENGTAYHERASLLYADDLPLVRNGIRNTDLAKEIGSVLQVPLDYVAGIRILPDKAGVRAAGGRNANEGTQKAKTDDALQEPAGTT